MFLTILNYNVADRAIQLRDQNNIRERLHIFLKDYLYSKYK